MLCDILKDSQNIKNLFSMQRKLLYLLTKDILGLNVNKFLEYLLYARFCAKRSHTIALITLECVNYYHSSTPSPR